MNIPLFKSFCGDFNLQLLHKLLHELQNDHTVKHFQGPVLKYNGNQKYATTAITAGILRLVAEKVNVPLQVKIIEDIIGL